MADLVPTHRSASALGSVRRRARPAVLGLALLAVTATGCGSNPLGGDSTPTPSASIPSPSPTGSAGTASPSASGSASSSVTPTSGTATPSSSGTPTASPSSTSAVRRGTDTGDDEVDVLVTVAFRSGKVVPTAPEVQVGPGERVKLIVTSDVSADIVVSGLPDANADVDPGESEDIDFTVKGAGTTTVTLRQQKVVLATFVTT